MQPERLEWFRDQGFGMFIHWSVDSQTGVVISHSLAGADEAYTKRFFEELPKTFNPRKFEPEGLGRAGQAGRHQVRRLHHQAPFRVRHVGHEDHGLRYHAHALQARSDARNPRRVPCAGHRAGHLLFAGRFLVAVEEQDRRTARHSGRAAAQQSGLDEARPGAGPGVDDELRSYRRRVLRRRAAGAA